LKKVLSRNLEDKLEDEKRISSLMSGEYRKFNIFKRKFYIQNDKVFIRSYFTLKIKHIVMRMLEIIFFIILLTDLAAGDMVLMVTNMLALLISKKYDDGVIQDSYKMKNMDIFLTGDDKREIELGINYKELEIDKIRDDILKLSEYLEKVKFLGRYEIIS